MQPWKIFLLSFALVSGGARFARSMRAAPVTAGALPELSVPFAESEPAIDGELDEPLWQRGHGRTGALVGLDGATARPFSEARMTWTKTDLVIGLYAADGDIRTSGPGRDAFRVLLGTRQIEVSANGALRGAPPGTRIGHESDGTLDDETEDEEWTIELAIPLAALDLEGKSGEHVDIRVERCETAPGVARACGTAVRRLVLADAP